MKMDTCGQALRACLHEGGGPQVGEVTCGGLPHLTCKRDQIKLRDCMNRRVTPPERVTSPTWGPPPPCKQAISADEQRFYLLQHAGCIIFIEMSWNTVTIKKITADKCDRYTRIHLTIGWRQDEHGTRLVDSLSVSRVRSKTMHSLFCVITS